MGDILSQKKIRAQNAEKILKELLRSGELARIDLANKCNVSPATVTQVVTPLIERNIIQESEQVASTGGRKPVLLQLVSDYGCIIVIEVLFSSVAGHVFDLHGNEVFFSVISDHSLKNDRLYKGIIGFVENVKNNHEKLGCSGNILRLGLLVHEDVSDTDLLLLYSTDVISESVPMEYSLSGKFGTQVTLDRIAHYSLNQYLKKTLTLASPDYIYIHIGESITATIVLDGKAVSVKGQTVLDVTQLSFENRNRVTRDNSGSLSGDYPPALTKIISSLLVLFPVNTVFLGGVPVENDKGIIHKVSAEFSSRVAVKQWDERLANVSKPFAHTLLEKSIKHIVRQAFY